MHWRKPLGGIALAVLFLTACSSTNGNTTTATTTTKSAFAKGPCPSEVAGAQIACGFLSVPADRGNASSKMIKLAVAIVQKGAAPDPNPVIFLQGGPGGSAMHDFAKAFANKSTTGDPASNQFSYGNHDVILLDQRGTGYSQPSLVCTALDNQQYQTDVNLTVTQQVAQQTTALNDCHTQLTGQGINLSAYTTYNDANDIHDLITALHYNQVSLYGVSYGTRVALEVMRSFPQGIKSVVLDSTVPPDIRLLTNEPQDTVRVFDTLFQGCANDATCSTKYPNLKSTFYGLVDKLNATPITFQTTDKGDDPANPHYNKNFTVVFNGDSLVSLLFESFYQTFVISLLPELITEIQQGTYTHLLSLFYGIFSFQGDSLSYGDYFSVECAEDVAFVTSQDLTTAAQAYPADIRNDQLASLQAEIPQCQHWNVKPAPVTQQQPVTSNIPTVVLEGAYDPVTPPSNGDHVAKTLTDSATYLFPATGHGTFFNPNSPCPSSIVQAFFANPNQLPPKDCIATMSEPQFQ